MPARILVAEDDRKQAELIRRYLEREGHLTVVVHDGRAAIDEARRRSPDLLVLDVMMPKVDGLDVCRVLRAEPGADGDVPIIMLTARSTEDDLLLGLDLGADDYLTKPYNPRELVGPRPDRTAAHARPAPRVRSTGSAGSRSIRSGTRCGWTSELVEVTPAEFKILACLAASPGRAFSRQQLLEHAFGFDHYVFDRTIDVHVMNLRKKIEPAPADPAYLKTVYGVGYKLADKVVAPDAS